MKTWSRFRLSLVRDKLQVFFLGLLLGLVLGGGFFLLKLDQYVQKMEIYKSLTQNSDEKDKKTTEKPDKERKATKKPAKTEVADNTDTEQPETDSVQTEGEGEFTSGGPASDEIVVRTPEIIGENIVALRNLDVTAQADSVARKEAGVRDEASRNMTVEYWKSPLNSKGYKLTRSRLVLFGYTPDDKIQLCKLDNIIYMKTSTGVFRLEFSSSYRQLERITDEVLVDRLNG
ncbi:MAG: hypothetical protein ACRC3B_06995 [Bacteroidia bacterium]